MIFKEGRIIRDVVGYAILSNNPRDYYNIMYVISSGYLETEYNHSNIIIASDVFVEPK